MSALGSFGPDDIRWLDGADAVPRHIACPVCGDAGPHAPLLAVRSMAATREDLAFLRCRACGSGLYDPPDITDFSEIGHAGEAFWRFYVEVGGGVWETIWPIIAVRGPRGRSMLDVGCGFGFAVDFWRRETGGEAIGVEQASYGRLGASMLGITVHDRLLDEIPELDGRRFDVVYASEVIEHVPDPSAFAALLARYVADDGVLVLTTPAMAFIARENHSPTLHAALAPGFHGFLLSEDAFASAVRRAGFAHIDVRTFGERQILWASRRPLDVDPARSPMLPAYLAYLDRRIAEGDPSTPVWQGLAYRSVKERVNGGRPHEARALAMRLLDASAAAFGEHVRDPQATAARIEGAPDVESIGQVMPYFVPSLYYYLGMIALGVDRDATAGVHWLEGAVACTIVACRSQSTLFLDAASQVWAARRTLAEIAIARGDVGAAAEQLAKLCREGDTSSAANGYATANVDDLERRAPALTLHMAERGHHAAARKVLVAYADYVSRRYGPDWLSADGVERALAMGTAAPVDPLFVPWLAALLDQAEGRADAATRVGAVAGRLASHPRHGPRIRKQAAVLRRHAPVRS